MGLKDRSAGFSKQLIIYLHLKKLLFKCKEMINKKENDEKNELINFEEEIADLFNKGKIRAPVHLYQGNENKIIEFLKE